MQSPPDKLIISSIERDYKMLMKQGPMGRVKWAERHYMELLNYFFTLYCDKKNNNKGDT